MKYGLSGFGKHLYLKHLDYIQGGRIPAKQTGCIVQPVCIAMGSWGPDRDPDRVVQVCDVPTGSSTLVGHITSPSCQTPCVVCIKKDTSHLHSILSPHQLGLLLHHRTPRPPTNQPTMCLGGQRCGSNQALGSVRSLGALWGPAEACTWAATSRVHQSTIICCTAFKCMYTGGVN